MVASVAVSWRRTVVLTSTGSSGPRDSKSMAGGKNLIDSSESVGWRIIDRIVFPYASRVPEIS